MDLRKQSKYRWFQAEDYKQTPILEREWAAELHGRYGKIYKYSDTHLVAECDALITMHKLARSKWLEIHQDCRPVECSYILENKYLDRIAEILKIKKKKKLSPEHKKKVLANLKYQPQATSNG